MPAGRPTKFKPQYIQEIRAYFDVEPYKKEIMEQSQEFFKGKGEKQGPVKKTSVKTKLVPNKMPTLFGFAKKIGVDYSNVYRWAEQGQEEIVDEEGKVTVLDPFMVEFRNAYKEAKELQKEFLIHNGLVGAANAPVTIFTAKNVTDMRDQVEVVESKTVNHILEIGPNLQKIYGKDPRKISAIPGEVVENG